MVALADQSQIQGTSVYSLALQSVMDLLLAGSKHNSSVKQIIDLLLSVGHGRVPLCCKVVSAFQLKYSVVKSCSACLT